MVGLDVTNRAVLAPEHADRLRGDGEVGTAVAEMLDFYLGFYLSFYEHGGAPIHDALAMAHIIQPDVLTIEAREVKIELGSLCRGRTVVDMRRRVELPPATARVAVDVDVEGFRELLLKRLANFPSRSASEALRAR
jgi:inosine-uridine nucleoside N-ribohydrolase